MGDLHIADLVVEYSSGGYAVRPIDGLNLDVNAGSLALLLGPSGCGKTTLLSCLGGILRPTPRAASHSMMSTSPLSTAQRSSPAASEIVNPTISVARVPEGACAADTPRASRSRTGPGSSSAPGSSPARGVTSAAGAAPAAYACPLSAK